MSSKILIFANDETTIYNFRRELIERLVKEKFKVVVCFPKSVHTQKIIDIGCHHIDTEVNRSGTNPIEDFKLFLNYLEILKDQKPDIVLTYTIKPNIYGSLACKLSKIPYINNVTGLGATFQKENLLQKFVLFLQKQALKKSNCVFFQNEANLKYFKLKKIVSNNARIIPGSGVNLSLHKFEEYPLQSDIIKFVTVSRVRKDKGYDELFEVAKQIKSQNKNIEFHIIGWYEDDNYKKIIDELCANQTIIYHGSLPQEEVHNVIKECHCLIHPSYHEGMSNVILEASACGRPSLASNIDGCREAIDVGKTGYTFNSRDTVDLSLKIKLFLKIKFEDKKRMGELARQKIEKEFDRNIVINAYLDEIKTIIKI